MPTFKDFTNINLYELSISKKRRSSESSRTRFHCVSYQISFIIRVYEVKSVQYTSENQVCSCGVSIEAGSVIINESVIVYNSG